MAGVNLEIAEAIPFSNSVNSEKHGFRGLNRSSRNSCMTYSEPPEASLLKNQTRQGE